MHRMKAEMYLKSSWFLCTNVPVELPEKHIQTLKCTTTPENRSVQTVQRSVHRSSRSVQTFTV
jgi:hypothetical protein